MKAVFEKIQAGTNESLVVQKIDQPCFDAPWHFHPECELTFISAGSGDRFVGDSIEPFSDGDLVLLGAELPHFWKSGSGRSKAVVVHFSKQLADGASEFAQIKELLNRAELGLSFSDDSNLSQRIGSRMHNLPNSAGLKRLLLLLEILGELSESVDSAKVLSNAGHSVLRDRKAAQRINRAYDYVYTNLHNEISLTEVAQAAGMSPAAFSRYFKRITGRNLTHFIGEMRISQACKLLRESDKGIAEIAYEVGFGSLSNFNRLFKQMKGMSPGTWRNSGREASPG